MRRPFLSTEPLGIPRGSVRAVLAILLVMAAVCLAFAGHLDSNQGFLALVVSVVSFYFAGRNGAPQDTTPARVGVPTFTPGGSK